MHAFSSKIAEMKPQARLLPCSVCSGQEFSHHDVLWAELISAWELSSEETRCINIQQGTCCTKCGSNVRSIALATAIVRHARSSATLSEWVGGADALSCGMLEINEAGSLTSILSRMPKHRIVRYPDYDMMALPFGAANFDMVVHSDTLEHVTDPWQALRECRRVLRPGGACCFTVPIVVGRLTRTREGMPVIRHGSQGCADASMIVHTEFGANLWCGVLEAGFDACQLVSYHYPAGIALIATVSHEGP